MAYGLYRSGMGGKIRKMTGNPRNKRNQRNIIVWAPTKGAVKSWIRRWGTKTQKKKHL